LRYLWRAVGHEGEVLESFITKDRDKAAALKFMKKAMMRFRPSECDHYRWLTLISRGDE
jgi:putative transposase